MGSNFARTLKGISVAWIIAAVVAVPSVQAIETTFVPTGSAWRYLDDGSDQGTAWRDPSFVDSGWSSGAAQLGYGDGDETTVVSFGGDANDKHITTYFRHSFSVTGVGTYPRLDLQILRDDGAVVYLNGTELHRTNMPGGTITASTVAGSSVGGGEESTFFAVAFPSTLLVEGTNVLAVEIHQRSPTSSDISFDLELVGSDNPAMVGRGPYLQQGTPSSVVVRWRTDLPSDSRVRYGLDPGALTSSMSDAAIASDHEIALTGLSADTRYYYSVGTTAAPLAGDASYTFLTPPTAGTSKPTRLWVIGDSGTADASAEAVRDAYAAAVPFGETDLWLMLGDNAYNDGTDEQYEAAVFDMYPVMLRSAVLWPTLGNHDGHSADSGTQTGPYYDIFSLPAAAQVGGVASGTEAYYSFDYGNIHFICLDSYDSDRSPAGAMLTWLELDLMSTTADWVIAFWHHPPYSKGSHNSDTESRLVDMRENALPILEDYGVDLVLSGHSHSYERSVLLDGHYDVSSTLTGAMIVDGGDGQSDGNGAYRKDSLGPAAHEGTVYAVAGSSGKISGGALNHPVMVVSLNQLGSMVLEIDEGVLDAQFLNSSGVATDHFTIVKGGLCPSAPSTGCLTAGRSVLRIKQADAERRRVTWKWLRGTTAVGDFGDPTASADYALCLYDQTGRLLDANVPSHPDKWRALAGKFRYRDGAATADGVKKILLKEGDSNDGKVKIVAKGSALPDIALPLALPVTAQLVNTQTAVCWEATYTSAKSNTATGFKAKLP